MNRPQIHAFGDRALIIAFDKKLDLQINRQVHQLWAQIQSADFPDLNYGVPANYDLTLVFKTAILNLEKWKEQIFQMVESNAENEPSKQPRKLSIPVCYDLKFGLDLNELAHELNLESTEIIELHKQSTYQVFSMGFLPGFGYLGSLDQALHCQRKSSPRKRVPKGSVAMAGMQTGIYPSEGPGGWRIIGRSPVPIFDAKQVNPFLWQPGDQVSFQSISFPHFREMENKIQQSGVNWSDYEQ